MIRNNICMNAHPVGCERNVARQIEWVTSKGPIAGPKNVLVIGASNGFGLSSRIVSAFGSGAATIGVAFESAAKGNRTGTAGWYHDQAFQKLSQDTGRPHRSIIGDAFSHEIKAQAIEAIRELMGTVDLVIYSLASGMRIDPDTGETYRSTLKPIGARYESVTLDNRSGTLVPAAVDPATDEEVANTIKVMGGEDWELWIHALRDAGVLAPEAVTVAYSYIGPEVTFPLYRDGTIGRAKEHLEETARRMDKELQATGGHAWVSVNKALVTRASSVIPAVPLYLGLLYRIMKDKGIHEGTLEQIHRLFTDRLYGGALDLDEQQRIRIDDWEMRADVQEEVQRRWDTVNDDNLHELGDIAGIQEEFLHIHGFGHSDVDYQADVTP